MLGIFVVIGGLLTTYAFTRPRLPVGRGDGFECRVAVAGTVLCNGRNDRGQLGQGETEMRESTVPLVVPLVGKFVKVAVGARHACALRDDHTLWCWGSNDIRQIEGWTGPDARTIHRTPILFMQEVIDVAAGESHTCVIRTDGRTQCWGGDSFGQLGNGRTSNYEMQVQTACAFDAKVAAGCEPLRAVEIAAGRNHTCALLAGGFVACWGANNHAQQSRFRPDISAHPMPIRFVNAVRGRHLSAHGDCTCLEKSLVREDCWGRCD